MVIFTKLPNKYLKAEDPCVDTLPNVNKQREVEIESNQTAVDGLEVRLKETEQELEKAEKNREQWMEKLNSVSSQTESRQADLIQMLAAPQEEVEEEAASLEITRYRRAPKGTMAKLLKALSE